MGPPGPGQQEGWGGPGIQDQDGGQRRNGRPWGPQSMRPGMSGQGRGGRWSPSFGALGGQLSWSGELATLEVSCPASKFAGTNRFARMLDFWF